MFKNKIVHASSALIAIVIVLFFSSKLKAIDNFESFVLKNGLTVYVMENNNIPAVVHSVFYKVGSIDEPNNKTGIAHLLEHLMFKGTKKYSGDEFLKTIKVSGGVFNAFTSHDYTGYYEVIPKTVLPKIMAMEADRMTNLSITKQMVDVEKQIVKEEKLLRVDTNVNSKFFQDYRSVFFKSSSYGRPVIGLSHDFETITLKDVLSFYKTYYSPQNAIVVITGNISLQEVKSLANKYYAEIPAINNEIPKIKPFEEEFINNNNYIHVNKNLKQPLMVRSYLVDSFKSTEDDLSVIHYEMIAYILSSKSGNLYKYLVNENKLAVDVEVSYNPFTRGNAMFSIVVVPNQGVKLDEINKKLDEFVTKLKKEGIKNEELLTYVTKFRNDAVFLRDDPQAYLFFIANLFTNEISEKQIRMYQNINMYIDNKQLTKSINDIFSKPYLNGFLLPNEQNL